MISINSRELQILKKGNVVRKKQVLISSKNSVSHMEISPSLQRETNYVHWKEHKNKLCGRNADFYVSDNSTCIDHRPWKVDKCMMKYYSNASWIMNWKRSGRSGPFCWSMMPAFFLCDSKRRKISEHSFSQCRNLRPGPWKEEASLP
jgi:hypothetical protein